MKPRDQVLAVTREILDAFERGEIPAALGQLFIRRRGDIPSLRWSWRNRLLAVLHGHLDARGFRQWQEVGRWVRRGEHAVHILGPVTRRAKEDDPERGVEVGDLVVRGFKAIPVFGYDQTEGEPLPATVDEASFLEALPLVEVARSWGLEVGIYDIRLRPRAAGYYQQGESIGLGVENLSTWGHELC